MKTLQQHINEKLMIGKKSKMTVINELNFFDFTSKKNIIKCCEQYFFSNISDDKIIPIIAFTIGDEDSVEKLNEYGDGINYDGEYAWDLYDDIFKKCNEINKEKPANLDICYANKQLNETDGYPIIILTVDTYEKIIETLFNSKQFKEILQGLQLSEIEFCNDIAYLYPGLYSEDYLDEIEFTMNKLGYSDDVVESLGTHEMIFTYGTAKDVNQLLKVIQNVINK